MSLLRRSGHRHKEVVELNITAFMNLMVVLVPFLLITAVFSQVAILDLNLPTDGSVSNKLSTIRSKHCSGLSLR